MSTDCEMNMNVIMIRIDAEDESGFDFAGGSEKGPRWWGEIMGGM